MKKKTLLLFFVLCSLQVLAQSPSKKEMQRLVSLVQSDFHLIGDMLEKKNHSLYEKHLENSFVSAATINNHIQEKYDSLSLKAYLLELKLFSEGFRWNFILGENAFDEKNLLVKGIFQFKATTKTKTYQNMDSVKIWFEKQNEKLLIKKIDIFKIKEINPFEDKILKLYVDSLQHQLDKLGKKDDKIRKESQSNIKHLFHHKGKILSNVTTEAFEVEKYVGYFDKYSQKQEIQERKIKGYTLCYLHSFYQDVDNKYYANAKKYMFDGKPPLQTGILQVEYKNFESKKPYYLFEQMTLEISNPPQEKSKKDNKKLKNVPKKTPQKPKK